MMYVEFMKNFLLSDSSEQMAVRVISASWPKNVWFLLSRHDVVEFMKIFLSPIRAMALLIIISASGAQKRLILTF